MIAEAAWSRQGVQGRRKRNQGRVKRLAEMRLERAQRTVTRQAKTGRSGGDGWARAS